MQFIKEHILFRYFTLVLAFTLVLPSAVKFAHAFNHSSHVVCHGKATTHIHQLDLDCKFYDFKLNHNYIDTDINFNLFIPLEVYLDSNSQYVFLNTFKALPFSLRGPPNRC